MREGSEVSLSGPGIHQVGKMTKENGRCVGQELHGVSAKGPEMWCDWIESVRGGELAGAGPGKEGSSGKAGLTCEGIGALSSPYQQIMLAGGGKEFKMNALRPSPLL